MQQSDYTQYHRRYLFLLLQIQRNHRLRHRRLGLLFKGTMHHPRGRRYYRFDEAIEVNTICQVAAALARWAMPCHATRQTDILYVCAFSRSRPFFAERVACLTQPTGCQRIAGLSFALLILVTNKRGIGSNKMLNIAIQHAPAAQSLGLCELQFFRDIQQNMHITS